MSLLKYDELERQADEILSDFLKNPKKNKMQSMEYPFQSKSQLDRIRRREIPISNLSKGQAFKARGKGAEVPDSNLQNL